MTQRISPSTWRSARTVMMALLLAAAAFSTLSFFAVSLTRLNNPLNNGPYEDASMQIAARFTAGQSAYVDANADFVPSLYAPGYFLLTSVSTRLFGDRLLAGRIISLCAVFATFFFICVGVSICARNAWPSPASRTSTLAIPLVALGQLASFHAATQFWLEFAKVDALFVSLLAALFAACVALLSPSMRPGSRATHVLGLVIAVLIVLLPFVKQTGVALAIGLPIVFWILGRRDALLWSALAICLMIAAQVVAGLGASNRFFLYLFAVPRTHPFIWDPVVPELLALFWPSGLLVLLSTVVAASAIARRVSGTTEKGPDLIARRAVAGIRENPMLALSAALLVGGFVISVFGRAKAGAVQNSWLYFALFCSVGSGAALTRLFSRAREHGSARHNFVALGAAALVLAQFATVAYDPRPLVARNGQYPARAARFAEAFCTLPKPVLAPHTPYYPKLLCGGPDGYLNQAIQDLLAEPQQFALFYESFRAALRNKRYGSIIQTNVVGEEAARSGLAWMDSALASEQSARQRGRLMAFRLALLIHREMLTHYRILPVSEYGAREQAVLREYPPGTAILVPRGARFTPGSAR